MNFLGGFLNKLTTKVKSNLLKNCTGKDSNLTHSVLHPLPSNKNQTNIPDIIFYSYFNNFFTPITIFITIWNISTPYYYLIIKTCSGIIRTLFSRNFIILCNNTNIKRKNGTQKQYHIYIFNNLKNNSYVPLVSIL